MFSQHSVVFQDEQAVGLFINSQLGSDIQYQQKKKSHSKRLWNWFMERDSSFASIH